MRNKLWGLILIFAELFKQNSDDAKLCRKICNPTNYKDITDYKSLLFATEKDAANFQLLVNNSKINCKMYLPNDLLFHNQEILKQLPDDFKSEVEDYLMLRFTNDDILDKKIEELY